MQSILYYKTLTVFVFSLVLILALGFFYQNSNQRFISTTDEINTSRRIIHELEHVLSLQKDLETGFRGYLLSRKPEFLHPYHLASQNLTQSFQVLDSLLITGGVQTSHLQKLHALSAQFIDDKDLSIAQSKAGDWTTGEELVKSGRGKFQMDQLRRITSEMQQAEFERLASLDIQFNHISEKRFTIIAAGAFLATIILILSFLSFFREIKRNHHFQNHISTLNQELEQVNEDNQLNNRNLEETNEKLKRAYQEKQALYEKLALKNTELNDKTLFLENTNKTLNQYLKEIDDLYNNAPCGYHSLNQEGKYLRINDTALQWLGYRRREIVGRQHFVNLLTPESQKIFKRSWPDFIRNGLIKDKELEMVCKNGGVLQILVQATAVYDKHGNFLSSRSTFTNHTALKKAQETILARNKELEAFTYTISHDLRSPLRVINGNANMLMDDYSSKLDVEGKTFLENIAQSTLNLDRLISDLLEFSMLTRKELSLTFFNMEVLVQEAMQEVKGFRMQQNEIQLFIHCNTEVWADYKMLKQVWVNLISNALKFSSKVETSIIEIRYLEDVREKTFYIKDNGAGFNDQYADNIFQVFKRLHSDEDYEGTGAGLAIVERIVRRHEGRIWTTSQVNEGATFYFTLPTILNDPTA